MRRGTGRGRSGLWALALAFFFVRFPAGAGAFSLAPGQEAYEGKDYEKAEDYFGGKARKSPGDEKSAYDWGNSLYRLGRYEEAGKAYEQALQKKPDLEKGWYNLGNSLFQQQRYQDAIAAYDKALQLSPDQDAVHNRDLAERMMKKDPKSDKSRKKKGQKDKKDQKPGNDKKDQSGGGAEDKKSQTKGDQGREKSPQQKEGNSRSGNQKTKDQEKGDQGQGNSQRAADQRRRDQAKRELGMSDKQVQNLLNEMQKREKQYQRYFSPNPRQEQKNQTDQMGAFSRQQREMIERVFGKRLPGGDPNQAQEDW